MIEIISASGAVLFEVPILSDAVSHEELMGQDFVRLSWSSDKGDVIQAGAYIRYNDENYSLLEPYTPEMVSEGEFRYRPEFHSRVDAWDKHPACVYSYDDDAEVSSKEFDWTFVGSPADAMYIIAQSILEETGEEWSVEISDSLPATIELTCQADSIKSILSAIAEQCDTDWWVDKPTNTLYLSNCSRGEVMPLAVGKEVGVPSVSTPNDGYYTRYYALGSTRNISQDSNEGSYITNKRLTLDPAVYPYGYKDVKGHFENGVFVSDLQPSEVFSKVLKFDDIYPSSPLIISDVRARLKYRVKDGGEKIVIGGTKEDPIYDQYAIWYFKIDGFSFDKDAIIKGQELSVHFNDGRLAGHDFKLAYHDKDETVSKEGDVAKFKIEKGDYEILFVEEGDMIIPDLAYIVPSDGDSITLYNIEMPSEYTASAMADLEAAVDKKIAEDSADQNTYEFNSNPVAFHEQEIDLLLGQNVALISGDKTTESRVTMIEKHLDFSFEQKIRIGRKVAKSTTTQLKEGLTSVNYNLNVIEAFNKLSESIYESHVRTQAQINEALLKLSDMFYWHDEAKTIIATNYGLISKQDFASNAKSQGGGGTGGNAIIIENWYDFDPSLSQALGAVLGVELNERLSRIEGIDFSEYATEAYVKKAIDDLIDGAPTALDTLYEIAQVLEGNVDSINDILVAIGTKAEKKDLNDLAKRVDVLEDSNDMFSWLDEEHTTIITDKNLVVGGDISDGGVGEAVVGVTVIRINGDDYYDERLEGVIDISDAFRNLDIDLSDYYTTTEIDVKFSSYYTSNEIDKFLEDIARTDMFEWYDEDHTAIVAKTSLVVRGDISDEGTAEAVVGVTAITIGDNVYYGEDGVIDLSEALGSLDIDMSGYYTSDEVDGMLNQYQPISTAINTDNIESQRVAYAGISDIAVEAYGLINGYDSPVLTIHSGADDGYDTFYFLGHILPEYNDSFFIGSDEYFYKCTSTNRIFAGSDDNNLWLLAGNKSGKKIIFGNALSCYTEIEYREKFAELGELGLEVYGSVFIPDGSLWIGDNEFCGLDDAVELRSSLIVTGDVSTAAESGGGTIVPDLDGYATEAWVGENFYTISDVDTMFEYFADNYYTDGEVDAMIADFISFGDVEEMLELYLPIEGGSVNKLHVNDFSASSFSIQAIYDVDFIGAWNGRLDIDGWVVIDGGLDVGALYVYGGGIYFDDDDINMIEVSADGFFISSKLSVGGQLVVDEYIYVDGDLTANGDLYVDGEISGTTIDEINARLDALEGK